MSPLVVLVSCRSVVEQYLGKKFEPFKPLPPWKYEDYLGWHEQGDGKLWYGVYVQVRAGVAAGSLHQYSMEVLHGLDPGMSWR